MFKFYVVGDTHGDTYFASKVSSAAEDENVHVIFQVGDFGVWDHTPEGEYYLNTLSDNAERRGVHWYVTLGNHENYDSIEQYQSRAVGSFIPLRENITVLGNKAAVFEMNGVKFGSVGGAVSIDRWARKEGTSWWPQENTKYGDVQKFMDLVDVSGPVDFLFTHDAPNTLPHWDGFVKDDLLSNANRDMMDIVGGAARAKYWFHGHYHRGLQYQFNDTQVVGMGANPEAMPWSIPAHQQNSVALVTVADDGSVKWNYTHEWVYQ